MNIENLVFKMLQQNTGIHMCDSGGENGRMWQRNAKKTLKDFKNEPEATLDIADGWMDISISTFHHLTRTLELDKFCDKFNKLPCSDWDGDFYGTSAKQCEWLEGHGFEQNKHRREFNTYNWDSNLSQVLQGSFLTCDGLGDYVLLQIHNGADVRGGYTDAKLFLASDYFLMESVAFGIDDNSCLDVMGSDISLHNYQTHQDDYLCGAELDAWMEKQSVKSFIGSQIGG